MCVSEKLARNGDYLLAFRDPSDAPLEPRLLIDNKDKLRSLNLTSWVVESSWLSLWRARQDELRHLNAIYHHQ